jgi:hypothetical protein
MGSSGHSGILSEEYLAEAFNRKHRQSEKRKSRRGLSVVIPVYNVVAFLPRCPERVTRQTLRDIEISAVSSGLQPTIPGA